MKVKNAGLLLLLISMLVNIYMIFIYAPVEKTMGIVQKVFYFHVASAWVGLFAFALVFGASIAYLLTRQRRWDVVAFASAEIGMIFTTMVLVTGPLWAKPIWNTWWTWDPRLTTTLVLWFMYLAYIALQGVGDQEEGRARWAAMYGIIAFVNVPLVFFSIRWWRTIHPVVIQSTGTGLTSEMFVTMILSVISFSLLYWVLLGLRYRTIRLTDQVRMLRGMVQAQRREG